MARAPVTYETSDGIGFLTLNNRVTAPDTLGKEVINQARQISTANARTLSVSKSAFCKQLEMDRPAAYKIARQVAMDNLLELAVQERTTEFLGMRESKWA